MKKRFMCLLLLILFPAVSMHAEDFLKKIRLNGFLSQAYMKSSSNNFLTPSMDGSFEINELGLAVSANITDKLRVGFQLFSRDLGNIGNNKVVLDWAFADYRFSDYFGLRLGRIKLPFGLYNEGRDTDFLRPMVFLPQSMYDEGKRGFMVAVQGAGIYGNLPLNKMGDVDYSFYAGTGNIDSEEITVRYFRNALNSLSPLTGVVVPQVYVTTTHAYGGRVIWNTPLSGLRVGASLLSPLLQLSPSLGGADIAEFEIPTWMIFSLEYTVGNFTVAAEYAEMESKFTAFGMELSNNTDQGYYVMASYMISDHFTISALYDSYYGNKEDKEGLKNILQGLPAHISWREDCGICLRYDFNSNWTTKVEWHTIDGTAQSIEYYNPTGVEQKWNYFIVKTSFNF
ncbi:MAG: hypothetical protein GY765_03195 [bacterium]|nr:hypothetical protein [bacterium]